jgi:hypothetical protein
VQSVEWPGRIEAVYARNPRGKEQPMRPHRLYPITQPDTSICIDDDISETPASLPTHRATRFFAILGLAVGIDLAVLMMLGTWLSLSPQPTDRATTFVMHSEDQTLSADELEAIGIPPVFLDDILNHF